MSIVSAALILAATIGCAPSVDPNSPDVCFSNGWCNATEYCAKELGDCWGQGVCMPRPTIPPPCLEPVCGCNGVTYANGWVAAMEGVSLWRPWACDAGDLDHNGHVDAADLDAFNGCMRGPELIYIDTCLEADTDYDYDVDLADYVTFQIMASPAIAVANVSNSDCAAVGSELGVWCEVDDSIVVLTAPGRMQILHNDATYNCCMTGVALTVSIQGSLISVEESELLEIPCMCLCCYDVMASVVNIPAGAYTLRYCWEDQDQSWEYRCVERPVAIP